MVAWLVAVFTRFCQHTSNVSYAVEFLPSRGAQQGRGVCVCVWRRERPRVHRYVELVFVADPAIYIDGHPNAIYHSLL